MGAEYQEGIIAIGRDINEAFLNVHNEALYDHGHAGYSGTMAEKPGATLVGVLPTRMTAQKFSDLLGYYKQYEGIDYYAESGTWIEYKRTPCPNGCREKFLAWKDGPDRTEGRRPLDCGVCDWYQMIRTEIKHRTSPIPKALRNNPGFKQTITHFIEVADEKWDNAAAVQLNKAERARVLKGRKGLKRGTEVFLIEGYCSS